MGISLNQIEQFFEMNLEVKRLLHSTVPKLEFNYDKDSIVEYGDKLYYALEMFEYYFTRMVNVLDFDPDMLKHINKLLKQYKNDLINCGTDFQKLKLFYNNCFSNMNEEFVKRTNRGVCGYLLFSDYGAIFDAKTANEFLHFFHHIIVNNENYYKAMPKLDEKVNNYNETITLCGKENEVAKTIFEVFPSNLSCGVTDIMALNNKILIMVRDKGHALTIEIDTSTDKYLVTYFIPKLCNILMIRNLRGIGNIDLESNFAVGMFETNKENIGKDIIDFINSVPEDIHMSIEGGTLYEKERGKLR